MTDYLEFLNPIKALLWSSKDVSVLCAGQADSGGVDNRHQLLYVFHQNPVEEPLIPLLDAHQIDVSVSRYIKDKWKVRKITMFCVYFILISRII